MKKNHRPGILRLTRRNHENDDSAEPQDGWTTTSSNHVYLTGTDGRDPSRAVASHLLVGVLTRLLGVLADD